MPFGPHDTARPSRRYDYYHSPEKGDENALYSTDGELIAEDITVQISHQPSTKDGDFYIATIVKEDRNQIDQTNEEDEIQYRIRINDEDEAEQYSGEWHTNGRFTIEDF